MSNYDANPVGFLYERYQSSGVSPLYEVEMIHGQAHAPIFQVRQGKGKIPRICLITIVKDRP